jgi:hypothetical protein
MISACCSGCGIAFSVSLKSSTRPAPKYCSRECFKKHGMSAMRNKAYAALAKERGSTQGHKKPRTRLCKVCDGVIDRKPSKHRTYCSQKCWETRSAHKPCINCGVLLRTPPSKGRKFCGRACRYDWQSKHRRKERTETCKNCGNVLEFRPSLKRKFCNRQCTNAYRKASSKPKADGRIVVVRKNGTLKWQRKFARELYDNKCSRCGYSSIPEILQVHHKDSNPRNQDEENIELLCPNCHEAHHFLTKTGRFGSHTRRKINATDSYKFKQYASEERMLAIKAGLPDPGPSPREQAPNSHSAIPVRGCSRTCE